MKRIALISVMTLVMIFANGCKDDDDNEAGSNASTGTYELTMDGNLVREGTSTEIGMMQDADANYTANATISDGDNISIFATGFSFSVDESYTMINGGPQVTISGKNLMLSDGSYETYYATSGTLTRVSLSKISFEGICSDMIFGNETTYSFSGFIESDAYEVIK